MPDDLELLELSNLKRALDKSVIVELTDLDGVIRYVNDKFVEISGYSREELLGKTHRLVKSGTHTRRFFRDLWRTIRSGQVWKGEIRDRAKDGSLFWLDTTITPLPGPDGELREFLAIRWPITDRKSSEESFLRVFNAVEQTADAVFITDRKGRIEYVNPGFVAITGYSKDEAVGATPRILKSGLHDRDYYQALWHRILRGEVHRATVANRRKSGALFYAEQTITPIKDSSGRITHFVSVVKDMTERRKLEEQRIEMEVAGRIQQRLYPEHPPSFDGMDLAGAVIPASQACGDYFDFVPMPAGSLGVVIGDVSGHGIGPALLMAEARAYLRSIVRASTDPCDILTEINRMLAPDLDGRYFLTMLFARFDLDPWQLVGSNAGHPSGYVLDANGAVKSVLDSVGPPLGLFADSDYSGRHAIQLERGDLAVFLTDGLLECEDAGGEPFEIERVLHVIREHRREAASEIIGHLQAAVRDFAGNGTQADDITLVVCKLIAPPSRPR